MDIGPFVRCSGNLFLYRSRSYSKSVRSQFYSENPPKATPKQVLLSIFFNIKRINRVLNTNITTTKHHSMINKRTFRFFSRCNTDTTSPFSSPTGHGVIKHIFLTYFIDIRSPQSPFRFKSRTRFLSKNRTHRFPANQIF